MRLIVAGCEYVGKTTLVNALAEWGTPYGFQFHLDDHFTIPDAYHLPEEERDGMWNMNPVLKERFQRFQIFYHVHLLQKYDHILLAGFHLEEAVYGPRYYYSLPVTYLREAEMDMPTDTILALLTARPEVLQARMEADPHDFSLVQPSDIEEVQAQFEQEFAQALLWRKFRFDTSDLQPEELLPKFLKAVQGYLNAADLVRLPAGIHLASA